VIFLAQSVCAVNMHTAEQAGLALVPRTRAAEAAPWPQPVQTVETHQAAHACVACCMRCTLQRCPQMGLYQRFFQC